MNESICIDRSGRFVSAEQKPSHPVALVNAEDISDFSELDGLLSQRVVRLCTKSFADGTAFSLARQLRLRGFTGSIELQGDLLPDQLPLAIKAGVDVIQISEAHSRRCAEAQWLFQGQRLESGKGYQSQFESR